LIKRKGILRINLLSIGKDKNEDLRDILNDKKVEQERSFQKRPS